MEWDDVRWPQISIACSTEVTDCLSTIKQIETASPRLIWRCLSYQIIFFLMAVWTPRVLDKSHFLSWATLTLVVNIQLGRHWDSIPRAQGMNGEHHWQHEIYFRNQLQVKHERIAQRGPYRRPMCSRDIHHPPPQAVSHGVKRWKPHLPIKSPPQEGILTARQEPVCERSDVHQITLLGSVSYVFFWGKS